MPSFKSTSPSAQLRRAPFVFISAMDPTIDWEKSECTEQEYQADPMGRKGQLHHTETPISIWLQHPTEDEQLIALGRSGFELIGEAVEYQAKGGLAEGVGTMLGLADTLRSLASLCIKHVENLEDAPGAHEQKKKFVHGTKLLTDEMAELVGSEVLFEVGAFLYRSIAGGGVDDATKKPSEPSSTGTTPESSTDTPIAVPFANETTTSGDGGDATDPQPPTNTPENE